MTPDPTPDDIFPAPHSDAESASDAEETAVAETPDGSGTSGSERVSGDESGAEDAGASVDEDGSDDESDTDGEAGAGGVAPEPTGPVTVRQVTEDDFFDWLSLYERYAAEHDTVLTDEKALRLWVWLGDPAHEENGFVAVADGVLVGLVNFHEFSRPLDSDRAVFIDDLYVVESARQRDIGSALIDAVRSWGATSGAGAVQWAATSDDIAAWQRYDGAAEHHRRVTFELPVDQSGD